MDIFLHGDMMLCPVTASVLRRTMEDVIGVTKNTVGCKIEVELPGESCFWHCYFYT